jgi:hypothetical protein
MLHEFGSNGLFPQVIKEGPTKKEERKKKEAVYKKC